MSTETPQVIEPQNQVETPAVEPIVETPVDPKKERNTILKEMSKEYGVNLFDAEGLRQFKTYQESQKTEVQNLQDKLSDYDAIKTENGLLKTKAETAELKGIFLKHDIQDETIQNKYSKLASLEEEGTKVERLEKAIGEYKEMFTQTPPVNGEPVVEQPTKTASGNPTPSSNKTENVMFSQEFYKKRYESYYANKK